MPQSFVQIRPKWNEIKNSAKKRQEAQILLIPPLMIKICRFDATWVMPQSFVQIRPNWHEME